MTKEQLQVSRELASKLLTWGGSRLRRLMPGPSYTVHEWAAVMANALIIAAVVTMKGTGATLDQAAEILGIQWQANNVETVIRQGRETQ